MNVLCLCSALNNSYIAYMEDGKIQTKVIKSDENNYHSLYIIPTLKEMNIDFNNLDFIGVNAGPGSFTGIRVALTITKIMANEITVPLVPLKTNEILLNAYNCDYLIMNAGREMFYIADKNEIKLVYKKDLTSNFDGEVLCDKKSSEFIENSICYEDNELDLSKTMLDLAIEKYNNGNKEDFNPLKVEANYIQTPPIFGA